jgi:hypothetical protein
MAARRRERVNRALEAVEHMPLTTLDHLEGFVVGVFRKLRNVPCRLLLGIGPIGLTL